MNATVLNNAVPEEARGSGVDAWRRLGEIRCPVMAACGNLGVPFVIDRSRALADRLESGYFHAIQSAAHLPQLECPAVLADLIKRALRRERR